MFLTSEQDNNILIKKIDVSGKTEAKQDFFCPWT